MYCASIRFVFNSPFLSLYGEHTIAGLWNGSSVGPKMYFECLYGNWQSSPSTWMRMWCLSMEFHCHLPNHFKSNCGSRGNSQSLSQRVYSQPYQTTAVENVAASQTAGQLCWDFSSFLMISFPIPSWTQYPIFVFRGNPSIIHILRIITEYLLVISEFWRRKTNEVQFLIDVVLLWII